MNSTPPVKMLIVANEEKKTATMAPIPCGYLKMEKGWNFDENVIELEFLLIEVKA